MTARSRGLHRLTLGAALAAASASCVGPDETGQVAQDIGACITDGPYVEGVDVSEFQGSIDWNAVHASGRQFAIARISDGTGHHDPTFAANWAGIRAAGMLRGAYMFFEPGESPTAQADLVVASIGRLGPGDLPFLADVEVMGGQSPATVVANLHTFLDRVQAGTGKVPMIYTGAWFWDGGGYLGGPGGFGSYPLDFSGYGNCATAPREWSSFVMWQYSDGSCGSCPMACTAIPGFSNRNATICGGAPGTSIDRDRYHGSLAELNAFAMSNTPPRGALDAADCTTGIAGWAQDTDAADAPINVHVYIGGPAGTPGLSPTIVLANVHRPDLCTAIGSCDHGFDLLPPAGYRDNAPHPVYAYGIDSAGGANTLLGGSPRMLQCPPPVPTLAPTVGVRRHIPSPDVMAAWHFAGDQVATLPDATLDAYPDGPDWPAAPALIKATGDDAIYVVEEDIKRHVPDPTTLATWQFDTTMLATVTPAQRDADLTGPDVMAAPFVARGSGAAIYVIDAPPPLWATVVTDGTPATLPTGTSTEVTLVLQNRGSIAWTPGDVWLAPSNPRDHDSALCDAASWHSCQRAVTVEAATPPGATGTFRVQLRPSAPAGQTASLCWGLVAGDTHWSGDPGEGGPTDSALCHAIAITSAGARSDGGVRDGATDGTTHAPGCGCATPAHRSSPRTGAVFAALAFVAARRRSRARHGAGGQKTTS